MVLSFGTDFVLFLSKLSILIMRLGSKMSSGALPVSNEFLAGDVVAFLLDLKAFAEYFYS